MNSGAFAKPCEYVGSVHWKWADETIVGLEIETSVFALADQKPDEYGQMLNLVLDDHRRTIFKRDADIEWLKEKVTWLCPNFVQVNPSLKAHCEAINRHINARYKSDQVVMVCRDKDNEASRFSYFQNALTAKGGSSRFQEFIVADESATLFKTDVASLYKTGTTVFVIPSWQESFVLAFLRKINETKGNREVIVYGMPQWLDNAQLSLDYYNSHQLRICTANFVHQDDPRAKAFRKALFNKYGKIPGKDAFLG